MAFDAETFTLTPTSGPPIAFDLGDIDVCTPFEYELTLLLYTGNKLVLSQFGRAFQNLAHDLREAYRQRLVQCLLLEDLEEIARFDGFAHFRSKAFSDRCFSSPAEFRLYGSNLAILPALATGTQWRLAEIESVAFDARTYSLTLQSDDDVLVVTKLAKRTSEFRERLEAGIVEINEKAARAVHDLFPFLTPDQFRQVAALMREGQAAPLGQLQAVHPKLQDALAQHVVDATLKPYFDALLSMTHAGAMYTGFKFIRREEEARSGSGGDGGEPLASSEEGKAAAENAQETPPANSAALGAEGKEAILHWFFFPLAKHAGSAWPAQLVAWEATSRGGRATYFFRLVPPEEAELLDDPARANRVIDSALRGLNRALVMLNFRREPIYLSDDQLEMQPRFRRYAIACRKLPELRRLRASFIGRAIHTSPDAWRKQVDLILE